MTLIVGNLDCESEFAALAGSGRRRQPSRRALRTLSDAATLLRAFARPGDRLWTPRPVDRGRLLPIAGVEIPELVSGPRPRLAGEPMLAWASGSGLGAGRDESAIAADGEDRIRRLAEGPHTSLSVAAEVAHRGLALEVGRELGCSLPGARSIDSLMQLRRHLGQGGADAGRDRSWVVKSPFSASGRLRFIAPGGPDPAAILDDRAVASRIERLLRAQGSLVFEPWMRRIDDWGCLFRVGAERTEIVGVHRLICGSSGRFEGIAVEEPGNGRAERTVAGEIVSRLRRDERDRLLRVAERVARVLRERGYRGPAGIDAWRFLGADGVTLHPLGEINPRLSFGWVWRGWRERLARAGDPLADGPFELRLGRSAPPPSPRIRVLLQPGDDGGIAAWLAGSTAAN